MKKMMAMMMMTMAIAASAANWTSTTWGRLEDPGNWDSAPVDWTAENAIFTFDGDATVATLTGFTNANTTVSATGCAVTFDITPGTEYAMDSLSLSATQPPSVPYTITGGGVFRTAAMALSGAGNRLCVAGSRIEFPGGTIAVGSGSSSAIGLALKDGATMGQAGAVTQFRVGNNSASFNTLSVCSGAILSNALIYVGTEGTASSNNFVIGANASVVGSQTLTVGYVGRDNAAHIMDGATLVCGGITLGHEGSCVGSAMLVEGAATTFNVNGTVNVGLYGDDGLLKIVGVPKPTMSALCIGDGSSGNVSHRNRMVVTEGERLAVTGNAAVGRYGNANSLEVSGMELSVGGNLAVGSGDTSTNNSVAITGGEVIVGGTLTVGSGVSNVVEMAGVPANITGGVTVLGIGNLLRVTGGETLGTTYVTVGGHYNRIKVVDGSTITATGLGIGGNNHTGNLVRVAGGGTLTTTGDTSMNGAGNRMEVAGGTFGILGGNYRMGDNGIGGLLSVTDGGTATISGDLYVGINAPECGLEVASGGTVNVGKNLDVGFWGASATGCSVSVDDAAVKVAGNFRPRYGAMLRLSLGGVPAQPLVTANAMTDIIAPFSLDIDAERLARAGGGKGIALMTFASVPAWNTVTNTLAMAPAGCRLTLSPDEKTLLLDVPDLGGTLILLR